MNRAVMSNPYRPFPAAPARRRLSVADTSLFFHAAVATELPVALWRLPRTQDQHAVAGFAGALHQTSTDFHEIHPGFVFAPFVNAPNRGALRIDADVHLSADGLHYADRNGTWGTRRTREQFEMAWESLRTGLIPVRSHWYTPEDACIGRAASPADYQQLVAKAIAYINAGEAEKVVASRVTTAPLPGGFDPTLLYAELCVRYPHAFVSLVAIPGIGTWLGASPETLLTIDDAGVSTMALAGTQRRPEHLALDEIGWGRKEIEEQEMVSAYIRSFFRRAGVRALHEQGPQTVAAGNIVHLQTNFRAELAMFDRLSLANGMLDELHPTSAVCGMPKDAALQFILDHEGYHRSFYSGFLGPIHMPAHGQTESHLFVNLRCMQLAEKEASLYVGAGITADSDPVAEWHETELKAQTMLAVLQAMLEDPAAR
jgi:isochorismate synthase